MTKKRIAPVRKYETAKFKVEETLLKSQPKSMPSNLTEEKEKFLRSGKEPKFEVKDRAKLDELASKTKNQIRFDLLGEAQYILDKVHDTYGNGEFFLEHAFGTRITKDEATPMLLKYIEENSLTESMRIHWCDNMACSAKLVWTGPMVNANRPDLRKYSLWINGSEENNYMRESGIRCLLDHEIGTHFFRSFNDGFQPWFSERERFGLRKLGTFEGQCTEEGLAAINTVLRGRVKFLWGAALAYYTACKAAEMTFKQLFDHLGHYTSNREYRWKQAMRVKRGLSNPNDLGGFGNDQCYFEGAVTILRNMDKIDFFLLMTGKVCHDELDRIKRMARKDVIHFPSFMKNMTAYRKTLSKMIALNCLNGLHPQKGPPDSFLKRLEERKQGKKGHRAKKVRANNKLSMLAKKIARNKQTPTKNPSVKTEEVESFKCSQPFINFHRKKKAVTDNILESSEAALDHVTQLSNELVTKDSSLDEQLEKLQEIVHGHSWANGDECYKHSLIREVEEEIGGSPAGEDSRCQSLTEFSEGDNSSAQKNSPSECDSAEMQSTNRGGEDVIHPASDVRCSPGCVEEQMTPSSSVSSFIENMNCNKEMISSSPTSHINNQKHAFSTPIKEDSCSSNKNDGLLQRRRLHYLKQIKRELLPTPVAELIAQDTMNVRLPQHCLPREATGSNPNTKKRISLNPPTEHNVCYLDGGEDEFGNTPALSSAQLKPDRIDMESGLLSNLNRRNKSYGSNIHIDVLDLANAQGVLPRVLDFKSKKENLNQSVCSTSSDFDLESVLGIKTSVFQPNVNRRRMSMSYRSPLLSAEYLKQRSHVSTAVIPEYSKNHLYLSESMDAQKSFEQESFFQPLIISSSKALIQKGCDVSGNKYPYP